MKKIITISREFGSGGRTIGKMVADKLWISFYDSEIIEKVAEESGYAKKYIEEQGEYSPSSSIFAYSFVGRNIDGLSVNDHILAIQRKIILELANKEACVIVGRCADYILKDRDDVLNVFIHADTSFKADRIVRLYGETDKAPEKRLAEKDKKRSINYKYCTDRTWGVAQNYDISLNSGSVGLDKCAELIIQLYKEL